MSPLTPSAIAAEDFEETLQRYESHVSTELRELEAFRASTLPERVLRRREEGAWLQKEEVVKLVEWKLKHGTFRPNLLKLAQSNPDELIVSTTKEAFAQYKTSGPQVALTTLCTLKGIGPATASLLLSQVDPRRIPFFSDELYRWLHWEDDGPKSKGGGWDRKIGYTAKEYASLVERIEPVRARLEPVVAVEVSALSIEFAAYVLGKERINVGDQDASLPVGSGDKDEKAEDAESVRGGKRPRTQTPDDTAVPRSSKKIKGKDDRAVASKTDKRNVDEPATTRSGRKTRSGKTS
ncbi:hypothetical protein K490DRAFT_44979 [Saccharata proteae CBS 121410]|uniref:Uncharacterized protein n=1 Tax=Saccharata proteae CBS 121410 TaxID=1314787 RepID=A0A9P4HVQ9_9PEZI|nr:hypothetical protein K490DRAFT_44979 [Saccharata proteae CBS 121410]